MQALATFHRPLNVQDQLAALQQQMLQIQNLMIGLQRGGMGEADARVAAQAAASQIEMMHAQNNPASASGAVQDTDEVMAGLLNEVEGGAEAYPSPGPASAINLGHVPGQINEQIVVSPAVQAFISPSKCNPARGGATTELRGLGSPPALPSTVPLPNANVDMEPNFPWQTELASASISHDVSGPSSPSLPLKPFAAPGLTPARLLQRFDAIPPHLAANRPQMTTQTSDPCVSNVLPIMSALNPVSSMQMPGALVPSMATTQMMPSAGLGNPNLLASNMFLLDGNTLQQLLQVAGAAFHGGAGGMGLYSQLPGLTNQGPHLGGGAMHTGGPSSLSMLVASQGRKTVDGEKVIPTLRSLRTINGLWSWLNKPPLGETGLSIIDREFRYRENGLLEADKIWRTGVDKNTKKRFSEVKKAYLVIIGKQQELNESGRRPPGGSWSAAEAAAHLDKEREENKLTLSSWVKRQCALNAKPRKRSESEEINEVDHVESANGAGEV